MVKRKVAVFDFDDTIVRTTEHICTCYSAVTGDIITNKDFLSEFTWDNIPRYKKLFRSIITAIQDDPSRLKFFPGFRNFFNKLGKLRNFDIVILSKRTGLKQIRDFMLNEFPDVTIEYAFVDVVAEKALMLERFHQMYAKIYFFDDRIDVMQDDTIDYCTGIYMPERTWNKYQMSTENLHKFVSYDDLIGVSGLIDIF